MTNTCGLLRKFNVNVPWIREISYSYSIITLSCVLEEQRCLITQDFGSIISL